MIKQYIMVALRAQTNLQKNAHIAGTISVFFFLPNHICGIGYVVYGHPNNVFVPFISIKCSKTCWFQHFR